MPNFTKMAIKQAFINLLEKKPLAQITVKNIVEECGINRNSFYYHYADIPTLIEEIVVEEADRIIEQYPTIDTIEQCLHAAVGFSEQNKKAILHIYNSVNRALFEQYLWKICEYVVKAYLDTNLKNKSIIDSDVEILTQYYKCECFGIAVEWISSGMKGDIEKIIHRICDLKKGMAEQMIERCTEK